MQRQNRGTVTDVQSYAWAVCLHSAGPQNTKRRVVPITLPIPCQFTCQHHGDRLQQRLHVNEVMFCAWSVSRSRYKWTPPEPELVWYTHHTPSSAIYTTSSDFLFRCCCCFPPMTFKWELWLLGSKKCPLPWKRLLIRDTGSTQKEVPLDEKVQWFLLWIVGSLKFKRTFQPGAARRPTVLGKNAI